MEGFLSTLPPYVHEFLGRHPPTDVFNLLKELVCFAVLYSEDRDRINATTTALLKKRHDKELDEDAVVPEPPMMASIKEEEPKPELKQQQVKEAKPTYNVRTGELIQTDKSKMANTMPEWWGHQESDHHPIVPKENHEPKATLNKSIFNHNAHEENHSKLHEESKIIKEEKPDAYGSSWISWDQTPTNTNTHHHRLERARRSSFLSRGGQCQTCSCSYTHGTRLKTSLHHEFKIIRFSSHTNHYA
ncbi:uncharacterized protein EV154DRAFT_245630 [Mucor mucedo]|uniref:uncharacterized protein n=1 Tax=Mucor mucedo TaxID=29922 RepID=UPI00221EA096|nr:uncharacterized protein EV154DRAFT_245630 [Mucor mucedo]KAI7890708.1 hypothetical protein EV154DRAFT_245630 [Mucor mucedo]